MKSIKAIKFSVIVFLLSGIIAGIGYGMFPSKGAAEPSAGTAADTATIVPMVPGNFSELADRVRSGVVNIQVTRKVSNADYPMFRGNPFGNRDPFGEFFGQFGGNRPERKQQGVGSGCIISRDGDILTNNHVIEDADQIKVKLADGKEVNARIIGRDPKTDLALIKVDGTLDIPPLKLGDSDALRVGNWVVAVGSPFGLEQTVTAGIVSAKGRVIGSGPYDNFIQTDASINPGNSGGPLINMQGEVVGINTAIIASGQGIGFAIPINMAKDIVPQLQKTGHVTRGLLGVSIQDLTPELARSFGLKETQGALIAKVVTGGPADKAGIVIGDVITSFNGNSVTSSKDLSRIVASTPVGETVTVRLIREGKVLDLSAKIGEMEEEGTGKTVKAATHNTIGLSVQNLTPQIASELGIQETAGVVVTGVEPGSAAAEAMVQTGDIIREVNRKPIKNASDFARKVDQAKSGDSLLLLIERQQNTLFVTITLK
jgi:serine protease Do